MKNKCICLAVLFFFLFTKTKAQDSLAVKWLDEVVITTGQYEPQSAKNSVYNVRTIPMEVIQARGAVTLEDVLNTELNIRFSQDAAVGNSAMSMQGLSGQNIKILMDGVPMTGRQGLFNEIDINQINIHTIERIEIVEGPMSTIYGPDALAGVINIITRKNGSERWDITAGILEKSVGNEYGFQKGIHNQHLGGRYAQGKWHAGVDLAKNYFGGWKGQNTGREKSWNPKDQITAGVRAGYKTQPVEIYYRLDYLYENIYNPGPVEVIQAIDEDYTTNRFMHQVQGSYVFSNRFRFSGIGSYTDYRRRKRTVVVDASSGKKTLALGVDSQNETHIDGVATRGTLIYKVSESIVTQAGFDINLEYGEGGRIKNDNAGIEDYAFFGSVEWEPLPGVKLRPGIRLTYNSVYGAPPVTPSINTQWALSDQHNIRLSYGRGFRSPSLRELYFDFFDSNHSIEGNTDLEAEISNSVNGTWIWKAVNKNRFKWSLTLGGFYNSVSNKIDFGQKPGNGTTITYINIDSYETHGFTWHNKINMRRIDATVGVSYVKNIFWSPEVMSTLSYKVPSAKLNFSLYYKYTGEALIYTVTGDRQDVDAARISPFHRVDLTVQKELFKHFKLSAGVHNLLDVTNVANLRVDSGAAGAHSGTTSTTPIGYGRSYFLGITYTLNHEFDKKNALL